MMTEKERGIVEGANFKTLWEVSTGLDGQIRYGSSSEQLTTSNIASLTILGTNTLLREELRACVLPFFTEDY
jgi:hypothetical protein